MRVALIMVMVALSADDPAAIADVEDVEEVEVGRIAPPEDGGSERDPIQRVLGQHHNAIRSCFQRQLEREPAVEGKVVVRFTIGPDGKVTKSEVTTKLRDALDACISKVIEGMVFPAPKSGSAVVTYPSVFKAE